MELVFDDKVGWYDPDEAYCPNHPGEPALYETLDSMSINPGLEYLVGDGGAIFEVTKVCVLCAD